MLPRLIEPANTYEALVIPAKGPLGTSAFDINESPVIGILSQPLPDDLKSDPRFAGKSTYLMQAYVNFMESAGARVVPILSTDSESVVADKLSKVNGVLFPGGDGDYLEVGKIIYDSLIAKNDAGEFFPLWGTCLGFENLAILASESGDPLQTLQSHGASLTLDFLVSDPVTETKMFETCADPAQFSQVAMTFNSHTYGLALDTFTTDAGLKAMFTPTSTSTDSEYKNTFVATMESPNYPFYGTQFHPEKVLTMYNSDGLNHSWESVEYNRYFADRFLELARQNTNTCGTDWSDCQSIIIDNYPITVTDTYYGNVYAFDDGSSSSAATSLALFSVASAIKISAILMF